MSDEFSVLDDYEFERRFFVREMPSELDDGDAQLIIQSYFVHADSYALRVRMTSRTAKVEMSAATDPLDVLRRHRDEFRAATVTVKGPSVGGTRYEAEREVDSRIAAELIMRGGDVIVKNRYTAWIGEDGWNLDVFGGRNYPLVIAECKRSSPVTNLVIPKFCVTEITDEKRFSNDELSWKPYGDWADSFEQELAASGPHFGELFGTNTMEE
ncbi:CYTH domain-containing protein [Bifidobacterium choloepi]|uniref:CYTH domain-containing protein n=1 Tax=Bifidobacterium choloepi TaxID=2614131 RepID=A0A6I5NCR3_9BIFI|nr:hypothetical protein [Bifidobacterium choloepi]NEG70330.1 hypothetical protein [Bifidobacterium choloepi]